MLNSIRVLSLYILYTASLVAYFNRLCFICQKINKTSIKRVWKQVLITHAYKYDYLNPISLKSLILKGKIIHQKEEKR